ncbi:MAG: DHHA1 domain-containing protein [Methanoregula sp.]|nr:DHHA1 domain-containing protein [Methanoregula sp.]
MSLETAVNLVAEQIKRQEYVEVVAHHDADGIAAGSILCHAMARAGIRFRLRVRREIKASEITKEHAYLLCDLGAGMEDLPQTTMVIDHHNPRFTGDFHANPRLFGIDGDREVPASAMAYFVARNMGDNRDLAGLAMLGVIGDGQTLSGKNLGIFNEGVGDGIINPSRGIRLAGRDTTERWLMAIHPYLEGISGDEGMVNAIMGQSAGKDAVRPDLLLSLSVLQVIQNAGAGCIEEIYGDTYALEREVIPDAHALAAVIDACGKSGHGEIGASLCMRYSRDAETAWDIARAHRMNVIAAIRAQAVAPATQDGVYEVHDATLISDIADALACQSSHVLPLAVVAPEGDRCHISVRCPPSNEADLGTMIRSIAETCGGSGGGHRLRAGATIPCNQLDTFRKCWRMAVAA